MQIVEKNKKITMAELEKMSEKMFARLVKAVVDIEQSVMAVDAGLHVDLETVLLEAGSKQNNVWGINFHPSKGCMSEGFVEFDSMINIRPRHGNLTRGVDNQELQKKIKQVVQELVCP